MTGRHFSHFLTAPRLLLLLLAFEYLVVVVSGVSFSFLQGDSFFSFGVDPLYWSFYGLQIPQFILANPWLAIATDVAIVVLLFLLIRDPLNRTIACWLFLLMILFYVTLTGYHTHRNFQTGFFLVLVPFLFKAGQGRQFAYNGIRYFLLFFYLSSAILKLLSPATFEPDHFAGVLQQQFLPYYLEGNTGWRTTINEYLASHPYLAQGLFLAALITEGSTVAGFFTKRLDRWLGAMLICFHLANWILMDIAPLGQLSFICLLFMGSVFNKR